MNLLLAADVRIVADNARLLSGFFRIGTHPGGGHMMLMAESSTLDAACAMAVFGEEIDGRRAQQLGLAWASLPEDQVEDKAMAMARYAARDPELARTIVRTLRMTAGQKEARWGGALQAERAAQIWAMRRVGRKREAAAKEGKAA
jgi:enoyl-CoA hydratase